MKLTDDDIIGIVESEETAAIDYCTEISKKRSTLMNYYNCEPYGDEVEGQSKVVTSDVSDTIETVMPGLMRVFTQGRTIAQFEGNLLKDEEEAYEKTELANYVFNKQNNGFLILNNMFKDALLQFTGTVKVFWDETETSETTCYEGLSEAEYQKLLLDPDVEIVDMEVKEEDGVKTYDCEKVIVKKKGQVKYVNIPPEEFLISSTARDFVTRPTFIGQRTPKTRSQLKEMGFDKEIVDSLPASESEEFDGYEKAARLRDFSINQFNASNHSPNDVIYISESYLEMDVNGDGITEYWQVIHAGGKVLSKAQVDDHPFCTVTPTPIPHRAIGTCPAEQVADIQYRKSHLERNMYDNVYQSNYPRVMHSNKVDLDDLLTPRAGGTIEIDTDMADVGGHAQPLVIPNMINDLLAAIEYTNTSRETRTGITRYSQGLDAEALNKTATGFLGMRDASQQREYLIARVFAETGVKHIFEKTVALLAKNQESAMQITVMGEELEIDPRKWGDNTRCTVYIGLGSGDRQEKIANLNQILQFQMMFMQSGMALSDQVKIYNTLQKIVDEVGLKEANYYFNNPEQPQELLQAQLEQATQMIMQMQQQLQSNPLAEAELVKAQARMAEVANKSENEMRKFIMEYAQKDKHFAANLAKDMSKLELEYEVDIPGQGVDASVIAQLKGEMAKMSNEELMRIASGG